MKYYITITAFFFSFFIQAQTIEYQKTTPLEDYNFVLGTQGIGGQYKFSNESALLEQAKQIRAMGSNILKISLGKNAPKSYGLNQINVNSTLALFQSDKDYKKVFDMDFKYIFAWVHTMTDVVWKKKMDASDEKKIYDEMFELCVYILKEYNNSGKTFMIGNWEGDWLLHPNYDRKASPPKNHTDNMAKWFQIRQKAVDDAKLLTAHENVFMYHYIEVNLVLKGMNGETCISSAVLPFVDVDFISYSSYESIKNKTFEEKKQTLTDVFNYIEKQLKPKKNLPFDRRVFIGEYGYHANIEKPESFQKQFDETKEIMLIALELNLPFALHWQMYNNEYEKNGRSKEMSLIDEKGDKRPLYFLHQNFYSQMNAYLKLYKKENKNYPTSEVFAKKAIEVLKEL